MYRFVEHTAELGLEIEADSEEGVFADALAAFAELVESDASGEPARREIELAASDRAALLVAWLEELVFLADTDAFEPEGLVALDLSPDGLRAVVEGRRAAPRPLVKAVTYHGLTFARKDGWWHARVVLDV